MSSLKTLLSKNPKVPTVARRQFLAGVGAGVLLFAPQAQAWQIVKGALPGQAQAALWPMLAATNFGDFTKPAKIPAEALSLEGKLVEIDGYQMAFDSAGAHNTFLLTAFDAHCPYCMPGGMGSIVTVSAEKPVAYVKGEKISLRGRLVIDKSNLTGFVYRLEQATLA